MSRLVLPLFLAIALTVLFPDPTFAGPRVGNGGGVWLCRERGSLDVRWMRLTDLFEAEFEHGLKLRDDDMSSPRDLYIDSIASLRLMSPQLNSLFEQSLLQDLTRVVQLVPKHGALTVVNDGFYVVRPAPESCKNGYIYFGQLANFTDDGRLFISESLWNSPLLSNRDRGALLVHEAVYKALRDGFGDRNSVRARQITALLFSTLSVTDVSERVASVLAKAAPLGEEAQVSLYPVRVACGARVTTEGREQKTNSIVLARIGNKMQAQIGPYRFLVQAAAGDDGLESMQIHDVQNDAVTSMDTQQLRSMFLSQGQVELKLISGKRLEAATLSCWSESRVD